jgi:S-(hydroxymethyl)glutathione dehydrogenase/alcohol dehydrogenase
MLDLRRAGKLDLDERIARRIDLREIDDAFRAMLNGEVIRTVIEFE